MLDRFTFIYLSISSYFFAWYPFSLQFESRFLCKNTIKIRYKSKCKVNIRKEFFSGGGSDPQEFPHFIYLFVYSLSFFYHVQIHDSFPNSVFSYLFRSITTPRIAFLTRRSDQRFEQHDIPWDYNVAHIAIDPAQAVDLWRDSLEVVSGGRGEGEWWLLSMLYFYLFYF